MESLEMIYGVRSSLMVILILIMSGFTAVRFAFTNIFRNTYQAVALFSPKPMAEQGAGIKLLSTENLLITLLLASSLSFSLLLFGYEFQKIPGFVPNSFTGVFIAWITLTMIVGFLFLIKFIFLYFVGWLFDLPLAQSAHYQEYQSMSHVFHFFFVLILGLSLISIPNLSATYMANMGYLFVAFFAFRQLILLLRLYVKGGYSIYYIFSYLCTTELIPWIICFGILLNR